MAQPTEIIRNILLKIDFFVAYDNLSAVRYAMPVLHEFFFICICSIFF